MRLKIISIPLIQLLVFFHFLAAHPRDRLGVDDVGGQLLANLVVDLSHDLEERFVEEVLLDCK